MNTSSNTEIRSSTSIRHEEPTEPRGSANPAGTLRSSNGGRALRIGFARAKYEVHLFVRRKDALFFTLLLPVMFLLLFGLIFGSGKIEGTDLQYSQVLVSGILAAGVASVSFVNLAISIANERHEGGLKRLAGTPMPKISYFIGKIGLVLATVTVEIILLLVIGMAFFKLKLPTEIGRWITFAWVLILGSTASTLLGIAVSNVPKSAKSAAAVVNLPFVALQFISGVYVPFDQLSPGVRAFASVFPLKWMGQGFRSVFLPDSYLKVAEPGHSWQHGPMALVLLAWCVLGGLLCARTFRWVKKS
jgi:ABC-2 type transport system permease protein